MIEIWNQHRLRYPKMNIQDYIKMIHQSVFGPRHIMSNPSKIEAFEYIENELKDVEKNDNALMVETIGNGYVRLYLHAVLEEVCSKEWLADAFVRSMEELEENKQALTDKMDQTLDNLQVWLKTWMNDDEFMKAKGLIFAYKNSGYPTMHHSVLYREFYHPHYRVIRYSYLKEIHLD